MGFSRRYFTSLLWTLVILENCLHMARCQDEESSRCLPRKTFFALLRLPEVGSNLAAYSRTARIIQDAKDRTDYANLKIHLGTEDGDDAKICLPPGVYLDLFSDPSTRRGQRMLEEPVDSGYENGDVTSEDLLESAKRSIATLAKNGDLPISIQDRSQPPNDDDEKRGQSAGFESLSSESLDGLMKILNDGGVDDRRNIPEIVAEYTLPNGELDLEALARDYPPAGKRNVAALARDYALPMMQNTNSAGKRNIAALARDFSLPNGKRNVGTLARDRMLPNGKRNLALLRRFYLLPNFYPGSKRSLGSVASTSYRMRYGKRYIGALARSGDFPQRNYDKRNMAALARNGDVFGYGKRNVGTLARDWSLPNQNRHGRSLTDRELKAERLDRELQKLVLDTQRQDDNARTTTGSRNNENSNKSAQSSAFEAELTNAKNDILKNVMAGGKRNKREIDYTDEYPLPVMQNTNVFDYEDMIEALTGEYPNTEKRFMGAGDETELQDRGGTTSGYIDMYQPSKRHIGALASLGWLPPFKAARFSRSPRYPLGRKDPPDGTASDDPANSSAGTLNPYRRPKTRYLQSLQGDCRHGFTRTLPLPAIDNNLGHKLHFVASNVV